MRTKGEPEGATQTAEVATVQAAQHTAQQQTQGDSHEQVVCPVARTAEIVCGKWTLLIIRDLATGTKRFSELERLLHGISPKTLSERLSTLEAEGVLHRRMYAEVPPKVEYSLTEKGRDLVAVIESMRVFGKRWLMCD